MCRPDPVSEKALAPFFYQIIFGKESRFWAFDIGNGALFEIAQYKADNKLTSFILDPDGHNIEAVLDSKNRDS